MKNQLKRPITFDRSFTCYYHPYVFNTDIYQSQIMSLNFINLNYHNHIEQLFF